MPRAAPAPGQSKVYFSLAQVASSSNGHSQVLQML